MMNGNLLVRRTLLGTVVTAASFHPARANAEAMRSPPQLVEREALKQLVLSVGPIGGAPTPRGGATATGGGRVSQPRFAHRFRVEFVESAGRRVEAPPPWTVELYSGAAGSAHLGPAFVRLDALARDVSLPPLFGFVLSSGDSIIAVARAATSDRDQPLYVRVTIDYEPISAPVSRLGVLPLDLVAAAPPSEDSNRTPPEGTSWEWTPVVDGRVVALTGSGVENADELVLEEVASGATVWHTKVGLQKARFGFGDPSCAVTVGARVRAGRTYRLTATYADDAAGAAGGRQPVSGWLLPSTTPTAAQRR